ncbi:MAG: hypothetical protein F4X38_08590 [Acidimicrobiaceae bacterium]|nr:hypothetical protein [Acidimicrobiaceae bacterium]
MLPMHIRAKDRAVNLASGALRRILPHNIWGDSVYALWTFRHRQGRFPALRSPSFYSDYLFVMKTDGTLFDPLRQFITDKEYVKYYIASIVGWQHTIKTYKILCSSDEVDQLNLEHFPCILKPNNSSGPVMIMTDPKQTPDRELLKDWFEIDYYKATREHNYKYLKPKVIVEEFFSADGKSVPSDYKILCFAGVPKIIQVDSDRYGHHVQSFYDLSWNRLRFNVGFHERVEDEPKPEMLNLMLDMAARLSSPFSFIRVDMYCNDEDVRVGELTNCPHSANRKFDPPEAEFTLGRLFEQGQYI